MKITETKRLAALAMLLSFVFASISISYLLLLKKSFDDVLSMVIYPALIIVPVLTYFEWLLSKNKY
ncbi:MAG: hypothetical protein HQL10_13370 [Nitrospirae bacterium]|nr:hypothetical protein [Nitrospirota bacterium]